LLVTLALRTFKIRDELPLILAELQWVWMHPALKAEIFALLEAKLMAGKQATGRAGMDPWQMLVLRKNVNRQVCIRASD